jgi:hypothetical protein
MATTSVTNGTPVNGSPHRADDLLETKTKGYHPSPMITGPSWAGLGGAFAGLGPFALWIIDEMRMDEQIALCLEHLKTPVEEAEIEVSAPDPREQAFVADTIQSFWGRSLDAVMEDHPYGRVGAEAVYVQDEDASGPRRQRRKKFDHLRAIHPRDARPWTYDGQLVFVRWSQGGGALDLDMGVPNKTPGEDEHRLMAATDDCPAKGTWWVHGATYSHWYGRSVLYPTWWPWRAKYQPDAACDSLLRWVYKWGVSPAVMRHPLTEYQESPSAAPVSAADHARMTLQLLKSGGILTLPGDKDEHGNNLWELEQWAKQEGTAGNLIDPIEFFNKMIARGCGIPDEVLTFQGEGSQARANVATKTFWLSRRKVARWILEAFIKQVCKPLCRYNGYSGKFTATVRKQQEAGPGPGDGQGGGGQGGNPPSGPGGGQVSQRKPANPFGAPSADPNYKAAMSFSSHRGPLIVNQYGVRATDTHTWSRGVSLSMAPPGPVPGVPTVEEIAAAAAAADPEPSEEAKRAGNYRKGHIRLHGLPITIETAKGGIRRGKAKDGTEWETEMEHHYGYVKESESLSDLDHIDCFIGDHPESHTAYIVDQLTPDGQWDEHKLMLGYPSLDAAREGYLACYEPGWQGLGAITEMPLSVLKLWIAEGDTRRPVDGTLRRMGAVAMSQGHLWDEAKHPRGQPANAGEFAAGGGADKPADKPAPKPAHGSRAASVHARFHDLIAQAHAARREAFAAVKADADAANEKAGEHAKAISAANGQLAYDSDDEAQQAFTDLDEAVTGYDDGGTPQERFEALKQIEAEARACWKVKQRTGGDPADYAAAQAVKSEHGAAVLDAIKSSTFKPTAQQKRFGVDDGNVPEAELLDTLRARGVEEGAAKKLLQQMLSADEIDTTQTGQGADKPLAVWYSLGVEGRRMTPAELSTPVTPEDVAENKKFLKSIIASARAARDELRAYAKHRQELKAIKAGEDMDVADDEPPAVSLSQAALWDAAEHPRDPGNGEFVEKTERARFVAAPIEYRIDKMPAMGPDFNVVEGEIAGFPITTTERGLVWKVSKKTKEALEEALSDPATVQAMKDAGITHLQLTPHKGPGKADGGWTMGHTKDGSLMFHTQTANAIEKSPVEERRQGGVKRVIHHEAGHGLWDKSSEEKRKAFAAAMENHPEVLEQIAKIVNVKPPRDAWDYDVKKRNATEVHAELNAMRHYDAKRYAAMPEAVRLAADAISGAPSDGNSHLSALAAIPTDGLARVAGVLVRRTGPDEFRIDREGAGEQAVVRGDAKTIAEHIDRELASQRLYGRALPEALARAAAHAEPDWTDHEGQQRAAKAFAALPVGTAVVSLNEDAGTHGRVGRIVKDDEDENRVVLDGEAGFSSNHVEPLDASLSWRVKEGDKPERAKQAMLFSQGGKRRREAGHWITIGAKPGEDGKKHGGTPVYVENGRITKGHPGLTGKRIDALKEDASDLRPPAPAAGASREEIKAHQAKVAGIHRSEMAQSKAYSRAVYAKTARKEGINPSHVHQLAGELLAHDREYKGGLTKMLQAARQEAKKLGSDLTTLKARAARGIDQDAVKKLDIVGQSMAASYPEYFQSGENAEEKLFDYLLAGNPELMPENEAYETALDELRQQRERIAAERQPGEEDEVDDAPGGGGLAASNEPIPFSMAGRPVGEAAFYLALREEVAAMRQGVSLSQAAAPRYEQVPGTAEWRPVDEPAQTPPIPLPDVVQQHADSCQESAVASVCKFFGAEPDTEAKAIKALGWTDKTAIAPAKVVSLLAGAGLVIDAREGMTIADLAAATDAGWPVIVYVQDYGPTKVTGAKWTGHVVTAVKVIPGLVIVQDPSDDNVTRGSDTIAAPGLVPISDDKFMAAWYAKDEDGREWRQFGIVVSRPAAVSLSQDAAGHQHKAAGPGGGQFTATAGTGKEAELADFVKQVMERKLNRNQIAAEIRRRGLDKEEAKRELNRVRSSQPPRQQMMTDEELDEHRRKSAEGVARSRAAMAREERRGVPEGEIDSNFKAAHDKLLASGAKHDAESEYGSRYYTMPNGRKVRLGDHPPTEATDKWLQDHEGVDIRVDHRGWEKEVDELLDPSQDEEEMSADTATPPPSHPKSLHDRLAAVRAKIDSITDQPVQAKLTAVTKAFYGKLEARYGRRQAIAIMGAGQALAWGATAAGAVAGVPIWLPGSSLWGSLPAVALAEGYLQAKRLLAKDGGTSISQAPAPLETDLAAGVRELLAAVFAEAGAKAPAVTDDEIAAAVKQADDGE